MVSKSFNRQIISPIVFENKHFLHQLARTKSQRKRKHLLKAASFTQLLSLAEVCLNILRSRFRLTTRQKKRLLPFADFLRRLSRARSERGARKVVQTGTGVGALFPALLTPILIEIAKGLISNNSQSK